MRIESIQESRDTELQLTAVEAMHLDVLPRLDAERTEIEQSADLFELAARWFLSAAEQLVRLGLIRDYEPARGELPVVRGRLEPLNTALLYYTGRLAFDCEYEDFT